MSSLWFNIRFGTYHWQWGRRQPMTFRQNPAQIEWRTQHPETWQWFQAYCVFGRYI